MHSINNINLSTLEEKLEVNFNNPDLLLQALVHRSYLNEQNQFKVSNERLEFLGDSVLAVTTSKFLYEKFPQAPEGQLTNNRSKLVQTKTLFEIANKIGLGKYLFMSKGEELTGGRTNSSLLANSFEAVLGALYLDQGIEACTRFVQTHLLHDFEKILADSQVKDYKSLLQERIQQDKKTAPLYQLVKSEGPDHAKIFHIDVYANTENLGSGVGKSKLEAEQNAAKNALDKLGA